MSISKKSVKVYVKRTGKDELVIDVYYCTVCGKTNLCKEEDLPKFCMFCGQPDK